MVSTFYSFEITCLKKGIHHTCHFKLSAETSIGGHSHHKARSTPLNSVVRSQIFLHGILLWLTDTAAQDHIMTHRYCGAGSYCIMIQRYCGTRDYYDSPVLGKGSHYDSLVLRHYRLLGLASTNHSILLRLTRTTARDSIVTHRYCATRSYYDSLVLRREILLWLTSTSAWDTIMTHWCWETA